MAGAETSRLMRDLPLRLSAAQLGLSRTQTLGCGLGGAGIVAALSLWPEVTLAATSLAIQIGFLLCAIWRVVLALLSGRGQVQPPAPAVWPRYTVMAALHDEAEIIPQLIERLSQIDYPHDRLEGFLLLEAHDLETIDAAERTERPDWLRVMVVPPGLPRTKPRALNYGLAHATGDLTTIYDAEDDPDPLQLREAAARFAADDDDGGRLSCLQAPLRIRRLHQSAHAAPFFDRQFAAEYAALFEVTLPALARLGLPFPLGGTSNHFRVDVLRQVGGWDAYNVTEDADLGFRLWRHGWRLGVIERPTYETPPGSIEHWLPQRCRWIKGYMQTWGVHTRAPFGLGPRGIFALVMTLGIGLVAAGAHGLSLAWVASTVLVAGAAGLPPDAPAFAILVLILGAMAAWLHCALGSRRARVPYTIVDMVQAPAYWALLSLAFFHAAWRLIREPHAWDKTKHRLDAAQDVDVDEVQLRGA